MDMSLRHSFYRCIILPLLLLAQFIEVEAAVTQVADATIGVKLVEQVEVNITHKYHLGVRCSFGTATVWTRGKLPTEPAIATKHSFSIARALAHTLTRE